MTLFGLTMVFAVAGVLITAYLVVTCWSDPVGGLRKLQHDPGQGEGMGHLPEVMLGRYIGFLVMAIGALLTQSVTAIFVLSLGLACMAWHDARTYKRAGKPYDRHVAAAVAATAITAVSGLTWITEGTA